MTVMETKAPGLLWLDLTRKCQLTCAHWLNDSGPGVAHGTLTRDDWKRVLDQAAAIGVGRIQFFGGEPTQHPDAAELLTHAVHLDLASEVYTNLVHVPSVWWESFTLPGVSIATSYYSDQAEEHTRITGRPTHSRTRANIIKALELSVPLRVGIVKVFDGQRVAEAQRELRSLGVTQISVDHVRPYGRGGQGETRDASGLCGGCGNGKAAISPDGTVSPCVFATWMPVGDVRAHDLADIVLREEMNAANTRIRVSVASMRNQADEPDSDEPTDDEDAECHPGFPRSGCSPRR